MATLKQLQIKEKWKKANVKISRELRDIIHGYVMSDGYITSSGSLQVDQSQAQVNFVNWLYEKLSPIRTNHPITSLQRTRNNQTSSSQRFYTKTLLQGFRNMWYKSYVNEEGKVKYQKRLPKSINCFFNATVITLWFAGDGTKTIGHKGAKIEVTAFTPDERRILQNLFLKKFNISANIIRSGKSKSGKEQWAISINSSDYDKFRDLITQMDLIPTLFPYKLHKKA